MCSVVGIDKNILKDNQENSGGCQYVLKDINAKFWEDVENDCENLYSQVFKLNNKKKKKDKDYHELQIWCADMWAVLWNLWKIDKPTKIIKELDFTWATHSIDSWEKNSIYHNAGIVSSKNKEFQKGHYRTKKPPKDLEVNPNLACYNYYQLIKEIL